MMATITNIGDAAFSEMPVDAASLEMTELLLLNEAQQLRIKALLASWSKQRDIIVRLKKENLELKRLLGTSEESPAADTAS